MCAIMAMQMESSICTHSEYVTAKKTGGFYRPFSFFAFFSKKLFKKVLTNREHGVIMISVKGICKPATIEADPHKLMYSDSRN